jgi:predicted ribosomally synthesized peptide with SipW-like signal peptide
MRRILFPLLVIGLAGGLFSLGSGAFFSDVEEDTGNIITAGTLDLVAGVAGTTSCGIAAYSPQGGEVTFDGGADLCTSIVRNDGTLTGDLYLLIAVVDTACSGPGEFCDEVANLGTQLAAQQCAEGGSGTLAGAVDPCASITNANSLAYSCELVATLDATYTYSFGFDLNDATVGNASPGDSITFNFTFELVQSGQAGDCVPA